MKTILITGSTGFVGSHIVERATADGNKVIASVRSSSNTTQLKKHNIPTAILSLSDPTKLELELLSIRKTYGNIDVIIHNAGVTQSLNNDVYYRINYILTKNLLDCLIKINQIPSKFILTSSIAALGPGNPTSLLPITEDAKPHPVTHYGKSKLMAEQYLRSQDIIPWIIIRPTIVYGPSEKNFFNVVKAINRGVEVYVGSKKQLLSFIYVSDLANSIVSLCDSDISNQSYNLSDGNSYSAIKINEVIKTALNKSTISVVLPVCIVRIFAFFIELIGVISRSSPILNVDKINEIKQLNWLCDSSKFDKDIGVSSKHDFKTGIIETIKWYKTNEWL